MTPQELFESALSYYNGTDERPQDYLKAYGLFLEAAEAGHIESQSYVGRMLSQGKGVEQNYAQAFNWYKKAADQGVASAQYNVGVMYANGQGTERNISKAREWFQKAADQGHEDAKRVLKSI